MSRGYMSHVSSDYICTYCGNISIVFDKGPGRERNYTIKDVYCPICMTETNHIRLGDRDVVRFELESSEILSGMDYEVYNLLCANDVRKEKQLIKK